VLYAANVGRRNFPATKVPGPDLKKVRSRPPPAPVRNVSTACMLSTAASCEMQVHDCCCYACECV
jgi:hypothetical protein